jgi:hypothetical protein
MLEERLKKAREIYFANGGKVKEIESGVTGIYYPCLFCSEKFVSIDRHEEHIYSSESYELKTIHRWIDVVCPEPVENVTQLDQRVVNIFWNIFLKMKRRSLNG